MQEVTIGLAFIAGLLSFVSPCVLPLVPAYVGYMGGRMTRTVATTSKSKANKRTLGTRLSTVTHSLAFILGFTVIFVSIGIATTAFVQVVGSSVSAITLILARVGGVIIILFGLHYMGALRWLFRQIKRHPAWLNVVTSGVIAAIVSAFVLWGFVELVYALPVLAAVLLTLALGGAFTTPRTFWLNIINSLETALYTDTRRTIDPNQASSLSGSFFMGMVFSAGWTPCIGPIYGGILNMSLQGGSVLLAGVLLAAYSLGLGIPFFFTALMLDGAQVIIRRLQKYMHAIEVFSGAILIVIGVLVASGTLQNLSQNLSPEQTDFSIRIEECGTGFFAGHLGIEHVGACIDGNLHPVAFNQSVSVQWTDTTAPQQFIFDMDESRAVDVQLLSVDAPPTTVNVQLFDATDSVIASSDRVNAIEDDTTYRALHNIALPVGRYRLVMDAQFPDKLRLRVKVTHADLSSNDDSSDSDETSAIDDLAQEGANRANNPNATDTPDEDTSTADEASSETGDTPTDDTSSEPEIGINEGDIAPDFTVTTIAGDELSLSDLRGEVVLINFWGTWCGPCRREMPELQAAYDQYQATGFEIIGLAVRDTRPDVLAFQDEFDLTFPLALDNDSNITNRYGVTNQPSTFIVDENGEIIFRWFGIINQEKLDEILQTEFDTPAGDSETQSE